MRATWLIVALFVILGGALAGVWFVFHRTKAAPEREREAGALSLPANFGQTITGTVRPQHVVNIGPTSTGSIEAFLADVGEDVFAGQTLARIAHTNLDSERENAANAVDRAEDRVAKLESQVNSARLEQSRAQADMLRFRETFNEAEQLYDVQSARIKVGAIPRLTFEKAEKDYENARQNFEIREKAYRTSTEYLLGLQKSLQSAQQALLDSQQNLQDAQARTAEAAELLSPVDGTIVGRNGRVGDPAETVGEQMFQIATDLAAMEVTFSPAPDLAKRLAPGMAALVLIPELSGSSFSGTLKKLDEKQAVVEFISNLPAVRPGMKADVRFKFQ